MARPRRLPGARGAGRGLGAAAAGACEAWRALRRRRGDRSARGARPSPQRHPPSGDPRGVRGAGPVSRLPLDPQRAWRLLPGSPSTRGPRAGRGPRVAPPPVPPLPNPVSAWLTWVLVKAPSPSSGREICVSKLKASQYQREEGAGSQEVIPPQLVPRAAPSDCLVPPTPKNQGLCLSLHSAPSRNASGVFQLRSAPRLCPGLAGSERAM